MPVSHDRKVKVEACKFGSQNNCKIIGEKGRVAGGHSGNWQPWLELPNCTNYRPGWREARGQKTNGNPSEAVQL